MRAQTILVTFVVLVLSQADGERIKNSIYKPILQANFCYRRANGTHQFGCSSALDGSVGVVQLVESKMDINYIANDDNGIAPYIALMTYKTFNAANLQKLKDSEKISGIILVEKRTPEGKVEMPDGFSVDSSCPNHVTSLYQQDQCSPSKPWNSRGSDIMKQNWPFPIVYITDKNTTEFLIKDCFEKYNKKGKGWPFCAIELDSFMNQATSSESCIRREKFINPLSPNRWCDPLGDQSAFMMLSDNEAAGNDSYPEKSVIVVSTRLDTVGIFDGLELGSESPSTGIAVMLAVAKLLAQEKPLAYNNNIENVLFAFLHGESFDYIGSSKMVYDMEQGNFPCATNAGRGNSDDCEKKFDSQWSKINLKSVKSYLELGQLYSPNFSGLFAHVDSEFNDDKLLQDLKNSFSKSGVLVSDAGDKTRGLPPASLQSMLKSERSIPGVLLTNFDQEMSNQYYHSMYDNYTNLGLYDHSAGPNQDIIIKLSAVAESVASFVLYEATGTRKVFQMDNDIMKEILNCFLSTSRCSLFAKSSTPELPPQKGEGPLGPYPQYIQVVTQYNLHTFFVQRVMTYFTGEQVEGQFDKDNCTAPDDQNIYRYLFVRGDSNDPDCNMDVDGVKNPNGTKVCGQCLKTTSWLSMAKSPAFIIDNYDLRNPKYSTWTESVWSSLSSRIFLKANPDLEKGFLACGISVFVLSFLAVFWIDKFSDDIFPRQGPPAALGSTNGMAVPVESNSHQESARL